MRPILISALFIGLSVALLACSSASNEQQPSSEQVPTDPSPDAGQSDLSSVPENILEEEVIIGEGGPYELGGTLTLPQEWEGSLPAVVLVHGSGPSDRDESVYAYKPFKDLAWGLAQAGIAVLRYDKRTYTHAHTYTEDDLATITVAEETVEDAILAAQLLKNDPRIDPDHLFLIGHSLGGMLAPRIHAQGGDVGGLIILAGSPRPLWEIIYDQNMALLETLEPDSASYRLNKNMLEKEMEKANKLSEMTEAEAMEETLFGLPAYYFKEMENHPVDQLLDDLDIPILILQGEDDFQVYADKDYLQWKDLLADNEHASFILYPGLNHFFISYEGEGKGTLDEYQHPNQVEEEVIEDIADWILGSIN